MATTAPEETKTRAPRTQAEYGIEEIDFLPPKPGRKSQLNALLEEVKETKPGKWLCVAKYDTAGAASATASGLRSRFGPEEANGWQFATRAIEEGLRTGLFVHYDGSKINKDAQAAYETVKAERTEKQLAKKAEKDRKEAKVAAKAAK